MTIKTITDEAAFEAEVTNTATPILVDFWAPWCGPCKQLSPVLDSIAQNRNDITVAKINVDEAPALAARFGIRGLPALMLFNNGHPQGMRTGSASRDQIESWIAGQM